MEESTSQMYVEDANAEATKEFSIEFLSKISTKNKVYAHWLFDNYKTQSGGNFIDIVVITLQLFFQNPNILGLIANEFTSIKSQYIISKLIHLLDLYLNFKQGIKSKTEFKDTVVVANLIKYQGSIDFSFRPTPQKDLELISDVKIDELTNITGIGTLIDSNNSFYYGFGFSGHAIGFYYNKLSNGDVCIYLINSGDGADYQKILEDTVSNYGIMSWIIPASNLIKLKRFLTICILLEDIIKVDFMYNCLLRNLLSENYLTENRYFYDEGMHFNKAITMKLQLIGNCTLNSVLYMIEILFREDELITEQNKFSKLSNQFDKFYNKVKLIILHSELEKINVNINKLSNLPSETVILVQKLKEQYILLDDIDYIKEDAVSNNLIIKSNQYLTCIYKTIFDKTEKFNIIQEKTNNYFSNNMDFNFDIKIGLTEEELRYGYEMFRLLDSEIITSYGEIENLLTQNDKINEIIGCLSTISLKIFNIALRYENYHYIKIQLKLLGNTINRFYYYVKLNKEIWSINQDPDIEVKLSKELNSVFLTYFTINKILFKIGDSDKLFLKKNRATEFIYDINMVPIVKLIIIVGLLYDKNTTETTKKIRDHEETKKIESVKLFICNFKIKNKQEFDILSELAIDLIERSYYKYFCGIFNYSEIFNNSDESYKNRLNSISNIQVEYSTLAPLRRSGAVYSYIVNNLSELKNESQFTYNQSNLDGSFVITTDPKNTSSYKISSSTSKPGEYGINGYFDTSHFVNLFNLSSIKTCQNFSNLFNFNTENPINLNWLLLSLNLKIFYAEFDNFNLTNPVFNTKQEILTNLLNFNFSCNISIDDLVPINFNSEKQYTKAIKPEDFITYLNDYLSSKEGKFMNNFNFKFFYYGYSNTEEDNQRLDSYKNINYAENNFNFVIENIDVPSIKNYICMIKYLILVSNDKPNLFNYHNIIINLYTFSKLDIRFESLKKNIIEFMIETDEIFNSLIIKTILLIENFDTYKNKFDINKILLDYIQLIKVRKFLKGDNIIEIYPNLNYYLLLFYQFTYIYFFDIFLNFLIENNIVYNKYLDAKIYLINDTKFDDFNRSEEPDHENNQEIEFKNTNYFYDVDEYLKLIKRLCKLKFVVKQKNILFTDIETSECIIINDSEVSLQNFEIDNFYALHLDPTSGSTQGFLSPTHSFSLNRFSSEETEEETEDEEPNTNQNPIKNLPNYLKKSEISVGDFYNPGKRKTINVKKYIYTYKNIGVHLEFENNEKNLYPHMLSLTKILVGDNSTEIGKKQVYHKKYNSFLQTTFCTDYSEINKLDWAITYKNDANISDIGDDDIIVGFKACDTDSNTNSYTLDFKKKGYELKINGNKILGIFDLINKSDRLIQLYCRIINFLNSNNEDRDAKLDLMTMNREYYYVKNYFNEILPIMIDENQIIFKCSLLDLTFNYNIKDNKLYYKNYEIIINEQVPYLVNKFILNTNMFLVRKIDETDFEYMSTYFNNSKARTEIFQFKLDLNGIQNIKDMKKLLVIIKEQLEAGNVVEADEILCNIIKLKYSIGDNEENKDDLLHISLNKFLDYGLIYSYYFIIKLINNDFLIFKENRNIKLLNRFNELLLPDIEYFNKFGFRCLDKNQFSFANVSSNYYKINIKKEKLEKEIKSLETFSTNCPIGFYTTLTYFFVNQYIEITNQTYVNSLVRLKNCTLTSWLKEILSSLNNSQKNIVEKYIPISLQIAQIPKVAYLKDNYLNLDEFKTYFIQKPKEKYDTKQVTDKQMNDDYNIFIDSLNSKPDYLIEKTRLNDFLEELLNKKNYFLSLYNNLYKDIYLDKSYNYRLTDNILNLDELNQISIQYFMMYNKVLTLYSNAKSLKELLDEQIEANVLFDLIDQKPIYLKYTLPDGNGVQEGEDVSGYVLIFEFIAGYYIRKIQYEYIKNFKQELYLDRPQNFHQFLMGQGKSTVIAPLLTLLIVEERADCFKAINQVMPETLVKQSKGIFSNVFFNINKNLLDNFIQIISDYELKLSTIENTSNKIYQIYDNNMKRSMFLYDEIDEIADPLKSQLNQIKTKAEKIKNEKITFKIIFSFIYNLYFNQEEKYNLIRNRLLEISFKKIPHLILDSDNLSTTEFNIIIEVYKQSIKEHLGQIYVDTLFKLLENIDYDEGGVDLEILNMLYNFYSIIPIILKQLHRRHFGYKYNNFKSIELFKNDDFKTDTEKYKNVFLAIPYDSIEKPSDKSEFTDHLYIIAITVICYFDNSAKRIRNIDIQMYIEWIKSIYINESYKDLNDNEGYKLYCELIKGINIKDVPNIDSSLIVTNFSDSDLEILARNLNTKNYLLDIIFPRFIRVNTFVTNISCIDLLHSDFSKFRIGFTGTPFVFVPFEYNTKYAIANVIPQRGGNGAIIASIVGLQKDTQNILIQDKNKLIEYAITNNYHVIIDVGCYFVNVDNQQVAINIHEKLISKKSNINTVVFIDKNNNKKGINQMGKIINYEEITEPLEKRFYYYDQAHITGIDMQIYLKAKGLITVAFFNRFRDVAQGIFRMRKINQGQTVDFCMDSKLHTYLKTNKLINFLISNEINYNQSQYNLFLKQNILTLYRIYFKNLGFMKLEQIKSPYQYLNLNIYNQPVTFDIINKNLVSLDLMKFFKLEVSKLFELKLINDKGLKSLISEKLCQINFEIHTDAKSTAINQQQGQQQQRNEQDDEEDEEDEEKNMEINKEIQKIISSPYSDKKIYKDNIIELDKYFDIDQFLGSDILGVNSIPLFYNFINKLFVSNIFNVKDCYMEVYDHRQSNPTHIYNILLNQEEASKILYFVKRNHSNYIFKIYTSSNLILYTHTLNKKLVLDVNSKNLRILSMFLSNNNKINDRDYISVYDYLYGIDLFDKLLDFYKKILRSIDLQQTSNYFILMGKINSEQLFDCMIIFKIIIDTDFDSELGPSSLDYLIDEVDGFIRSSELIQQTKEKYLKYLERILSNKEEFISKIKIVLKYLFDVIFVDKSASEDKNFGPPSFGLTRQMPWELESSRSLNKFPSIEEEQYPAVSLSSSFAVPPPPPRLSDVHQSLDDYPENTFGIGLSFGGPISVSSLARAVPQPPTYLQTTSPDKELKLTDIIKNNKIIVEKYLYIIKFES